MAVTPDVRRNAAIVGMVGLGYLALQAVVTGFDAPLGDGEADWAWLHDVPVWLIRAIAMTVSSAGLVVAFRMWVRPTGKISWTTAAAFAVSWLPLAAGSRVDPAVPVALACLAATGCATRWLLERGRFGLFGVAGAVALATALQPLAGVSLAAGLLIVLLVWARRGAGPGVLAVVAGVAAGAVPRLAAGIIDGRMLLPAPRQAWDLRAVVAAVDGPLTTVVGQDINWLSLLWLAVLAVLAVTGVLQTRWPHRRNAALTGVTVAVALTAPTWLLAGAEGAGALLAAYALFLLAVAAGVLHLWHRCRQFGSPVATIALVLASAAAVGWQISLAARALSPN